MYNLLNYNKVFKNRNRRFCYKISLKFNQDFEKQYFKCDLD